MYVQNDFLDKAEGHGLPQAPGSMPITLLADISTEQYLLDKHPFGFVRYVYSQVTSDVAPLDFDLAHLSRRVASNIAGKMRIQNNLDWAYSGFCYKQPAAEAEDAAQAGHQQLAQLPPAFAQPLSEQQMHALRAHCSSVQLEELQQLFSLLHALTQQILQQSIAAEPEVELGQSLLPVTSIKDALSTLMGHSEAAAHMDADVLPLTRPAATLHVFDAHGLQELCLENLQPVVQFFTKLYHQQEYQFANVSPLLKAPLTAEQADALQQHLTEECMRDPANAQHVRELAALLRVKTSCWSSLSKQARVPLHQVCTSGWEYEPDSFPLTAISETVLCSQYVAVMKIMLEVRHDRDESQDHVQ